MRAVECTCDPVQTPAWAGPAEGAAEDCPVHGLPKPRRCCIRYLRHSLDLLEEWTQTIFENKSMLAAGCVTAHTQQVELLKRIVSGEPCPWYNGIPEDYLIVMKMMGGSDGR